MTNTTLTWLRAGKLIEKDTSVQSVVGTLLVDPTRQEEHATSVCTVLNRWRVWSDRGGMTIDGLENLKMNKKPFCNAAYIMGLFQEVCTRGESTVALDMREYVPHWKKHRLRTTVCVAPSRIPDQPALRCFCFDLCLLMSLSALRA